MPFVKALLAAETETLPAIDPIVTEYSDVKVPAGLFIMLALMAVILIAVAVVSFIYINRHGTNYAQSITLALLSYIGLNYFVYSLALFGLQYIPGVMDFAAAHARTMQMLTLIFAMAMELLAMYLAVRLSVRASRKRSYYIDICTALMIGLVFYLAAIFISRHLSFTFEYFFYGLTINRLGFDQAVTEMVQAGANKDEAIASILELAEQNPWDYFWDSLIFILTGIQQTAAAIVLYGVFTDQLEKKWMLLSAGFIVSTYAASAVSIIFFAPVLVRFLILLVISAATLYITWRILKGPMSREIYTLTHRKQKEPPKDDKPAKMPTIVMPKD